MTRYQFILGALALLVAVGLCATSPGSLPSPTEPAPTPTLTVEQITADIVVAQCLRWLPLIVHIADQFPDLQVDVVLSLMAQESACLSDARDAFSPSVGLMQVAALSGRPSIEDLYVPSTNVYWGMRILSATLNDEEHNPHHDLRRAMAAYNCGWEGVETDHCGRYGGLAYADRIIRLWWPRVGIAIADYCMATTRSELRLRTQDWLREEGYCP